MAKIDKKAMKEKAKEIKGKVKSIEEAWAEKKNAVEGPTAEEIAEQERLEEEEINQRLSKYASVMPKINTEQLEDDDDEEEEEFTIDLSKGVVTQKVAEGLFIRDKEGNMKEIPLDEGIITIPEVVQIDAGDPYGNYMRDLLVRKAIAKLVRDIRVERDSLEDQMERAPTYLMEAINESIKKIDNRRIELTVAIRGNEVHYDSIPNWAETYIKEYIERTLTNLILLGEE